MYLGSDFILNWRQRSAETNLTKLSVEKITESSKAVHILRRQFANRKIARDTAPRVVYESHEDLSRQNLVNFRSSTSSGKNTMVTRFVSLFIYVRFKSNTFLSITNSLQAVMTFLSR